MVAVMAAKREQLLWESTWSLAESLEKVYSLRAILSAGVRLFAALSPVEREAAIRRARGGDSQTTFDFLTEDEVEMLAKFRSEVGADRGHVKQKDAQ
jgi:hypothetical protein